MVSRNLDTKVNRDEFFYVLGIQTPKDLAE